MRALARLGLVVALSGLLGCGGILARKAYQVPKKGDGLTGTLRVEFTQTDDDVIDSVSIWIDGRPVARDDDTRPSVRIKGVPSGGAEVRVKAGGFWDVELNELHTVSVPPGKTTTLRVVAPQTSWKPIVAIAGAVVALVLVGYAVSPPE